MRLPSSVMWKSFFSNIYKEERYLRSKVDGLFLPCLGGGQAEWLERLFTEEEVKKVVWSLDGDKASRRNGFSLIFYKVCWNVIRTDLMLVM